MKRKIGRLLVVAIVALSARAATSRTQVPVDATRVSVAAGTVSFEVATNVFGTTVRGTSRALMAAALVRSSATELRLERLEASMPVTSLRTGINLRDQHMLKYIFKTADGQLPDLHFAADAADCPRRDAGAALACVASGALTIRGAARPFAVTLEIEQNGEAYRVKGSGQVTLGAYGIERPSQFGVRTEDEVRIRVDFSARRATSTTARAL